MTDLWLHERRLAAEGYGAICGVDEAGRGPLAGPLYVAACVLPPEDEVQALPALAGLDDSKKLTAKRREALYDAILAHCRASRVARRSRDHRTREHLPGDAARHARGRHVSNRGGLRATDAMPLGEDLPCPHETLVHGDRLSVSIAAASILAKVSRDRAMLALDAQYPGYGFARHKGYGTAAHQAALDALGPTPVHRPSFLERWGARQRALIAGSEAERACAAALRAAGWRVLAQNVRIARLGEVDLIAARGRELLVVEVKARRSAWAHRRALAALSRGQLERIEQVTRAWLEDTAFPCDTLTIGAALVGLDALGQPLGVEVVPVDGDWRGAGDA